jgi:hypothetical protein
MLGFLIGRILMNSTPLEIRTLNISYSLNLSSFAFIPGFVQF